MNGMKNNSRYTFNSYSEALKKLNLLMKPINENYNNGKQLNLIGEQEDDTKFVLKQPESETADSEETEDFSFDDAFATDDGGEDLDMDMDIETELDGGEMDTEVNVDIESDEDGTKAVQKLTGKLGQKLRELPEPEMTADIIKYVLNSIISAVDLEKLSEDDKDEIVGKFESDKVELNKEFFELKDGAVIAEGNSRIRDLNNHLKWNLPEDGPKTINGLITEFLETIPQNNLCVAIKGYKFEILEIEDNAISKIKIKKGS